MSGITLRQLAAHLGMGKSTVQRALAGATGVNPDRRQRVLDAARELGYRPNPYFSVLSTRHRRSGKSGLAVAHVCLPFSRETLIKKGRDMEQSLRLEAENLGFRMEEVNPRRFANQDALLRQVWSRGAAGIVVGTVEEGTAAALRSFGRLPVVSTIREVALPFHTVRFSVGHAVRLCWAKLWQQGYRRIGCAVMRHDPEIPDDLDRLGAALAMAERDLPPAERIPPLRAVIQDNEAFVAWLRTHKPEAVIGFNPGMYWYCKTARGRPIPFVCLHVSQAKEHRHIPGAFEPAQLHAKQAMRQLDSLIRVGECGIPEHACDVVIQTVWHDAG